MQKLIWGWTHQPGKHCASTVLSDVSRFYGHNLSESLCLGLGAGLGFFYMEGDFLSPSKMIMTRSDNLEGNFFLNLGLEFAWRREPDLGNGWEIVKESLDRQIPVLLRADIFHLPYYQSKTHFPFHVIMLWGYDDEKRIAYIADTGWEGLIGVPLEALSNARYPQLPYYEGKGEFFPVAIPGKINELKVKIEKAILLQARTMEMRAEDNKGWEGVAGWSGYQGLRMASEKIWEWGKAKDASWCFRWAYQIIERRGTGGGAFRKLYAQFLREVGEQFPELKRHAPCKPMEIIAEEWTGLSMLLKELSEKSTVPDADIKKISNAFLRLAELEKNFFTGAVKQLNN